MTCECGEEFDGEGDCCPDCSAEQAEEAHARATSEAHLERLAELAWERSQYEPEPGEYPW